MTLSRADTDNGTTDAIWKAAKINILAEDAGDSRWHCCAPIPITERRTQFGRCAEGGERNATI